MPEFRFSMIIDGVERVKFMDIPEEHIRPPDTLDDFWKVEYRKNRINTRLNAWALSQVKLSYEELITHEST